MINHIKLLKRHKALKGIKLENLRKINVICGRNNSGKTTILEAVREAKSVLIGENLRFEEHWKSFQEVMSSAEARVRVLGREGPVFHFLDNSIDLQKAVRQATELYPIVYSDNGEEFGKAIWQSALKVHAFDTKSRNFSLDFHHIQSREKNSNAIEKVLTSLFSAHFTKRFFQKIADESVVLVEPKRDLSNNRVFQARQSEVKPNGDGLVHLLFSLKSKLPNSPKRILFEKLWETFKSVSGSYQFDIDINEETHDLTVYFSPIGTNEWRRADDCGLGLQDLLVIIYFALEPSKPLVLIEEPENHLHPEMQRRLLRFLKEDTPDEKQFILATHSNIFLDDVFTDRVFRTAIKSNNLEVDDATDKARILNDLGYAPTDNLVSDVIVIVEGPGDVRVITEFLRQMGVYGRFSIRFWPLNGDLMEQMDLSLFAEHCKVFVLLDSDPKSERKTFKKHCRDLGIPVTTLKRYSIENYFPIDVYRQSFPKQISEKIHKFDPMAPVWEQLNKNISKSDLKKGLEKFAKRTIINDLAGTDLWGFLESIRKFVEDKERTNLPL